MVWRSGREREKASAELGSTLMRQNGLDGTDLEAVFARVARQQGQLQMPAMDSGEVNLQS